MNTYKYNKLLIYISTFVLIDTDPQKYMDYMFLEIKSRFDPGILYKIPFSINYSDNTIGEIVVQFIID